MKKIVLMAVAFFILMPLKSAFADTTTYYNQFYSYTVQSGDTLSSIAYKHQFGKDEIINANPSLQSNQTVYTGEVIQIPDLSQIKSLQDKVVSLINVQRSTNGLAPLQNDWQISRVARYKANDMRDLSYFSHYSPTYGDPFAMLKCFGIMFTTAGENLAGGTANATPQQVVDAWMASNDHRALILDNSFTRIGVGYSYGGVLTNWWSAMFTN